MRALRFSSPLIARRNEREAETLLEAHRTPTDAMLDALLILVGALLLIVPGVLSDVVAILLLLRPLRERLKPALRRGVRGAVASQWRGVVGRRGGSGPTGDVIDVEPEEPSEPPPGRPPGWRDG